MIEDLRRTGLARLGVLSWVKEFTDHLDGCEKWPGHVKARPRAGITCNAMSDVMAAPRFLDYAKSFTPLASEYFGEQATLWSLNAFYTDKDTPYIPSLHGLHRDREAPKILCLFMLGTNTASDGAQLLFPDQSDLHGWHAIWGIRGTAWIADTTMLHCGLLSQHPRMIAWARWSAPGYPPAFHVERLPVVPA